MAPLMTRGLRQPWMQFIGRRFALSPAAESAAGCRPLLPAVPSLQRAILCDVSLAPGELRFSFPGDPSEIEDCVKARRATRTFRPSAPFAT